MSFDNTLEVDEYDAAYLWLREEDGRAILAFRGSDTQKNLENVRSTATCSMYGHQVHAAVAEGEFAPLVTKMTRGDFSYFKLRDARSDRPLARWRLRIDARGAYE